MAHAGFCPYVGLQPYTEDDRQFFFGREREQRIISSNLYASPLTVVYGPSGVGKSSILRAGVVPRLRAAKRTVVVYFNQWQDPSFLGLLKTECLKAAGGSGQLADVDPHQPLNKFLADLGKGSNSTLLILLDQFEEYFLYHPEAESVSEFDGEFASAVNQGETPVGFMIALRDDWLSRMDRFQRRIPNLLGNTYRLDHLTAAAAEDAIRKPLDVYNTTSGNGPVQLEDELVHEVLAQVRAGELNLSEMQGSGQAKGAAKQDRIETAFLQLVLIRLWNEEIKAGSGWLRVSTLRQLGGAKQIVQSHLDSVLNTLPRSQQDMCARMFRYLVTPRGSKIAHETADLVVFAEQPAKQVTPLLERLADPTTHLLRRLSQPERYEIFHDVLGPAVLDWRTRYAKEQERVELEKQAKVDAQRRSAKRMRWLSFALATFGIIVSVLAVYSAREYKKRAAAEAASDKARIALADFQRAQQMQEQAVKTEKAKEAADKATRQANIALAHELAAVAPKAEGDDEQTGILLALKAVAVGEKEKKENEENNENNENNFSDTEDALRTALEPALAIPLVRPGHDVVAGIALSPDGKHIATAGQDGKLIIWQPSNEGFWKPLFTTDSNCIVRSGIVLAIAFSADSQALACAARSLPQVFSVVNGKWIFKPDLTKTPEVLQPQKIAFGKDGKQVIISSSSQVQIWNVSTGVLLQSFPGPLVALSRDGNRLARWSNNNVHIWDLESNSEVTLFPASMPSIPLANRIALSPDGSRLAVANIGPNLWGARVVDASPEHHEINAGEPGLVIGPLAFSPDGHTLALAAFKNSNPTLASNRIILWDLATGQGHDLPLPPTVNFSSLEFAVDGSGLVLSSTGSVFLGTNAPVYVPIPSGPVRVLPAAPLVALSPDAKTTAVASSKTVFVYGGDHPGVLFDRGTQPNLAVFSPDRRYLAVSDSSQSVTLWDLNRRTPPVPLKSKFQIGAIEDFAFSPNSDALAVAGSDGSVYLWSIASSTWLRTIKPDGSTKALGLAFSPDGTRLAVADENGVASVWAIHDGESDPIYLPPQGRVGDVAFTPDGKHLMAVGQKEMWLWDLGTRKAVQLPKAGTNVYFNVMFSSDGKRLAATSADGLKLWAASSGWKELPDSIKDLSIFWLGAGFSPDGKFIAGPARPQPPNSNKAAAASQLPTASKPSKDVIAVWETDTLKQKYIQPIGDVSNPAIKTAVFSADGSEVYAVAANWIVYRYPLEQRALLKAAQEQTRNRKLSAADCEKYLHRPCPDF